MNPRRILFLLLALSLLLGTAIGKDFAPGDIPDDGERIPKGGGFSGLVPNYLVLVKVSGSPLGTWVGSGSFITQRLILTCHHNVRGLKNNKHIKIQMMDGTMYTNVSIEHVSSKYDLALLRVKDPFVDYHQEIDVQDTHTMTPVVATSGFDPSVPGMSLYQGRFNGKQYGNVGGKGAVFRATTCRLYPGMSGGPLIDQELCLIGVNSSYSKDTGSLCTMIEHIRTFLDEYDGPYEGVVTD